MPNKPETGQNIGLKDLELVDVETLTFVYREIPDPIEIDQFDINANVHLQWSDDAERFRSVTEMHVTPKLDTESFEVPEEIDLEVEELREYELCVLANAVIFEAEKYSDYISDGELDLPSSTVISMSQVSLDTTRGVLSEKLRGTDLDNLTMPFIDVDSMSNDHSEA